jgi:hypothetical protein
MPARFPSATFPCPFPVPASWTRLALVAGGLVACGQVVDAPGGTGGGPADASPDAHFSREASAGGGGARPDAFSGGDSHVDADRPDASDDAPDLEGGEDDAGSGTGDGSPDAACGDCSHLPNVKPGTVVGCTGGHCVVPADGCVEGFAHCSTRGEDGCETDLSRPETCGSCTQQCTACVKHFAGYGCDDGCTPAPPYERCGDHCFDLASTYDHCGACDINCPFVTHAETRCIQGQCLVSGPCFLGWGDCTPELGCETRLDSADNCGVCGHRACAFANTTFACSSAGQCLPPVCLPGFVNCDETSADCETSIDASSTCAPKYAGTIAVGALTIDPSFDKPLFVATAIAPDNAYFQAGTFDAEGDFDPTAGTDLRAPVGQSNGFITKILADGSYGWTIVLGGSGAVAQVSAIAVAGDGSLVAAGSFSGTVDFDPGPGVSSRTTASTSEGYVVKLAADGSLIWVRTFDPATDMDWSQGSVVGVDGTGSVIVAGEYSGVVDLDPSSGQSFTSGAGNSLMVKLTSDGGLVWGQTLPDSCHGIVASLRVATDGSSWVAGQGSCDAGDGMPHDNFLQAFTADGHLRATLPLDYFPGAFAIADDGSTYVGGAFVRGIDLDPGPGEVQSVKLDGTNGFLVKLGADFTFRWGTTFDRWGIYALEALPDGGVLAVGNDLSTIDAPNEFFIARWTATGASMWTLGAGGHHTPAVALAVGKTGFQVAGIAHDSADYDPSAGKDIVTSSGNFLSRYSF